MKCACCGYEYNHEIGEKPFIDILLSNAIKFQIYKGMSEYEEVNLKACPECKTVKMTTWID